MLIQKRSMAISLLLKVRIAYHIFSTSGMTGRLAGFAPFFFVYSFKRMTFFSLCCWSLSTSPFPQKY